MRRAGSVALLSARLDCDELPERPTGQRSTASEATRPAPAIVLVPPALVVSTNILASGNSIAPSSLSGRFLNLIAASQSRLASMSLSRTTPGSTSRSKTGQSTLTVSPSPCH